MAGLLHRVMQHLVTQLLSGGNSCAFHSNLQEKVQQVRLHWIVEVRSVQCKAVQGGGGCGVLPCYDRHRSPVCAREPARLISGLLSAVVI